MKSFIIKKPAPKPTITVKPKPVKVMLKPIAQRMREAIDAADGKQKPGLPFPAAPRFELSQRVSDAIRLAAIEYKVILPGVRSVTGKVAIRNWRVLATASAAKSMDISPLTLANWVKEDMVPGAVLKRTDTPIGNFYHEEEVREIARLFLDHQRTFKYYRRDHLDLRQKLKAAIESVRLRVFK